MEMDGKSDGKRKRNVNFSKAEEEWLVELVGKRKDVLENKRTDAVMWKEKERCWEEIEKEFNSNVLLVPRTAQQLQLKFKNVKRNVRKKNATVVQERRRTGGGANVNVKLNDVEEKVKGMILLSVEGMASEFDSDGAFDSFNTLTEDIIDPDDPEEEEVVGDTMLDAEVNEFLPLNEALGTSFNSSLLPQDKVADSAPTLVHPAQDQTSTSRWNSYTQPQEVSSQRNSGKCSWDVVTPRNLKQKKSTPLRSQKKRYKSMTAEATNILVRKDEEEKMKKKYIESEMALNEEKKINIILERDVLMLERERKSLEIEKLKLEIRLLQDKVKDQ